MMGVLSLQAYSQFVKQSSVIQYENGVFFPNSLKDLDLSYKTKPPSYSRRKMVPQLSAIHLHICSRSFEFFIVKLVLWADSWDTRFCDCVFFILSET